MAPALGTRYVDCPPPCGDGGWTARRAGQSRSASSPGPSPPAAETVSWHFNRRLGVAVAALGAVLLVAVPSAPAQVTMSGAAVAGALRLRPLNLTGYEIRGPVRLAGRTITHAFTCHDCVFKGGVVATRATFGATLDLNGSSVLGATDLAGARFEAPVLAGATFRGPVDLSLATFAGLAIFEQAAFVGGANLDMATFDGDAVFAHASSGKACSRPPCRGDVTFTRASFRGVTDFSYFRFYGSATFDGAQYRGPAAFGGATFVGATTFDGARFSQGATFAGAYFLRKHRASEYDDSFSGVTSNGDLDFDFSKQFRPLDFEQVFVRDTLSFNNATLAVPSGLHFFQASIGNLEMPVSSALVAVMHVGGADERGRVLGMIESGAKARNDLGVANDAHYESQVLRHHDFPVNVLDFVFYRTFAGYFVRPFNPLLTLLALAALITVVRLAPALPARRGEWSRTRQAARPGLVWGWARRLGGRFLDTLSLVGRGGDLPAQEKRARRAEAFVYRALLACAVIGFANSNPTLRQMLDAIR